nr:TOBE domain-containing protein [uncultured Lentibacter sp.]
MFVRPENVAFECESNTLTTRLLRRDLEGPFVNLFLQTATGADVSMHVPNTGALGGLSEAEVRVGFDPEKATILPSGPVARTGQDIAAQ